MLKKTPALRLHSWLTCRNATAAAAAAAELPEEDEGWALDPTDDPATAVAVVATANLLPWSLSEMSELFDELSLISAVAPCPDLPGLPTPAIIRPSTVLLLLAIAVVGPEVTRRWARGELGGRGRRTTETTLWVCSQIRRNLRMFPENTKISITRLGHRKCIISQAKIFIYPLFDDEKPSIILKLKSSIWKKPEDINFPISISQKRQYSTTRKSNRWWLYIVCLPSQSSKRGLYFR